MLFTFLTVLSAIWVVLYTIGTIHTIWLFLGLTRYERSKATITLNPVGGVAFLLCVSWLITRWFT